MSTPAEMPRYLPIAKPEPDPAPLAPLTPEWAHALASRLSGFQTTLDRWQHPADPPHSWTREALLAELDWLIIATTRVDAVRAELERASRR